MLSLSLLKFSWATDPAAEQKYSWKHTMHDVSVVFDSFRSNSFTLSQFSTSKIMKVVQGSGILDVLDIEEKVKEARTMEAGARNLGIEVKNDQLPISGLFQSPVIALRYNLPDGNVRRLQMKFVSDNDFKTAFQCLNELGVKLSTTNQSASGLQGRDSSRQGPSCPPIAAASLNRASFDQPVARPLTAYDPSLSQAQTPHGGSSAHFARPQTSHWVSDGRRPLTSSSVADPFYRPSSRALPSLPAIKENGDPNDYGAQSFVQPQSSYIYSDPVERASTTTDRLRYPVHRPSSSQSSEFGQDTSLALQRMVQSDPIYPSLSSNVRTPRVETLSQILPPRRELPFRRTSGSQGSSSNVGSRPPTSTAELAPLPAPNVAGKDNCADAMIEVGTPSIAATAVEKRSQSRGKIQVTGRVTKAPVKPRPSTAVASTGHTKSTDVSLKTKRPLTAAGQVTQNQLQHHAVATPPPSSPKQADRVLPNNFSGYEKENAVDHLDSYVRSIDRDAAAARLADFTARPPEERVATIDDMILQCINSDDFMSLCRDLHGNWRRIAICFG